MVRSDFEKLAGKIIKKYKVHYILSDQPPLFYSDHILSNFYSIHSYQFSLPKNYKSKVAFEIWTDRSELMIPEE